MDYGNASCQRFNTAKKPELWPNSGILRPVGPLSLYAVFCTLFCSGCYDGTWQSGAKKSTYMGT